MTDTNSNLNIDPTLVINELLDQIKQLTADKAMLQAAVNQLSTAMAQMQADAEEVSDSKSKKSTSK